jgi:hypothetical protein
VGGRPADPGWSLFNAADAATVRTWDSSYVIRLVAEDDQLTLTDQQVDRIRLWLLALIPATGCKITPGPTAEIVVADHEPKELTAGLLRRVEEIAGTRFRLTDPTA